MARPRRTILPMHSTAVRKDCPRPKPSDSTVYARTLHRACLVLGGVTQLARHLHVSESEVSGWLKADGQPPLKAFLSAVEIVLLHAEEAGGQPS